MPPFNVNLCPMSLVNVPQSAAAWNCTTCRRNGVLWVYAYEGEGIRVPGETAVNLRLAEPEAVVQFSIDHFEGLVSFKGPPRDRRCIADYWV
jgi:hypothetical protein